jgi:hypothetical protein
VWSSIIWTALLVVVLLGLCALFVLLGAFGSAAIALICAISRLVSEGVRFKRPTDYLQSDQSGEACMLVAAHPNALEWHLFIGDRGVVDGLLNKPMIEIPNNPWIPFLVLWFRLAHTAQLVTMTSVAAIKGWDGICLVILTACHYVISWFFRSENLAEDWMQQEKIAITSHYFEFSGRRPMIGAIQVLSGTDAECWMDTILGPEKRRKLWLDALKQPEVPPIFDTDVKDKTLKKFVTDESMTISGRSSYRNFKKHQRAPMSRTSSKRRKYSKIAGTLDAVKIGGPK